MRNGQSRGFKKAKDHGHGLLSHSLVDFLMSPSVVPGGEKRLVGGVSQIFDLDAVPKSDL